MYSVHYGRESGGRKSMRLETTSPSILSKITNNPSAQSDVGPNEQLVNEDQRISDENVHTPQSDKDLQTEYERLKQAQAKARLLHHVQTLRVDAATSFQSSLTLPFQSRDEVVFSLNLEGARKKKALMKEKLYAIKTLSIWSLYEKTRHFHTKMQRCCRNTISQI